MKLGMFTDSALIHGARRKLIVAHDPKLPGFFAILDFADLDQRVGAAGTTPDEALAALEIELVEDAAQEMIDAGAV